VSAGSQPGSLAEEARRLVEALDGRLHDSLASGPIATGSAECRLCPVCRMIALVRDRDDPDVRRALEALGDAAAAVLGLLDSVLDDRRKHRAPADVEHIDIG
jgi:hypothetical protein